MVSRSANLQPLLAALTAAGVPVNLQVESQANPNLLVGIRQGANQALVKTTLPGGLDAGVVVRLPSGQSITIAGTLPNTQLNDPSPVRIRGVDVTTGLVTEALTDTPSAGLTALLVEPIGSTAMRLQQEATTNELQVVQHLGTTGIDPRKPDPGLQDSARNGGSFTSPGANVNLLTLTPGTAGHWQVYFYAGVQGTVAVADADNVLINKNNSFIFRLGNPTGPPVRYGPYRFNLAATDELEMKTNVAGTVGSKYLIGIHALRTG